MNDDWPAQLSELIVVPGYNFKTLNAPLVQPPLP